MKKIVIAISLFVNVSLCFATPQIPDLLIIGKETFMLYSFPLEYLKLAKAPFDYRGYSFPGTACYRGYQATWKILDNKLFLVHVNKVIQLKRNLTSLNILKKTTIRLQS